MRDQPDRIREVTAEVESMGLKVIAQYGLHRASTTSSTIIDAPDEATMARAAITLAARGTMRTTTLQAIAVEELIESLEGPLVAAAQHPPHRALLLLAHLVVVEERRAAPTRRSGGGCGSARPWVRRG